MRKEFQFRRNVYIILITILALAALIQIARSQFVLQFKHNEGLVGERDKLLSNALADEGDAMTDERYCLFYESADAASAELKDNAARTLAYMKRQAKLTDLSRQTASYDGCTSVLVATGNLDKLGADYRLEEFVYTGGSAFLLQMPEDGDRFHQMYRKLGILSFEYAQLTNGIHLTSNVLLGEKGLKTGEEFIFNISNAVDIDEEAELLAESLNGIPLLWKRLYGEGNFMVFNGNQLHLKNSRGLLAGAISLMQPDYLYPIFNSKIFYIDDFPAPIGKELEPNIYRQYKMDLDNFYRRIWWPDMLKAAMRYNIKYTAAMIQSYQDNVNPPFRDPSDEERHNLIAYGREVIKSGGEIAIHGYNHQSLQRNKETANYLGYKVWPDRSAMEGSIQEVLRYLGTAFPNYKAMSYVPPSNVLGWEDGRKGLKAVWPDLTVIASLYDTDYDYRSYVQEYEVADDGIVEMPRITSGYVETPYDRWLEANTITSLGIFSHFLHPDDLIDATRRSRESWEMLYEDFSELLERLDSTYPWLRAVTSTEAGLDVAVTLAADVRLKQAGDRIEGVVENYSRPLHYVLRTKRKLTRLEQCAVSRIDEGAYLVKVLGSPFSIGLGG